MADVLLSYAREDLAFTRGLAERLRADGRDVWVDLEGIPPSAEWWEEIRRAIDASQAVVFVLSPHWLASEIARQELDHATAAGKRLIPVVHEDVDAEAVPPELARRHWIFWRSGDDAGAAHDLLVDALDTDLEWVRDHTRLHLRATEWDAGGRHHSALLRGRELADAEGWLIEAAGHEPAPTPQQIDYLVASRQNATRRQRRLLAAVGGALLVLVAALVVAVVQRAEARHQAEVATSRALAASADAELASDPELSVLLAAEAYRTEPTPQATAALRAALARSNVELRLDDGDDGVGATAFSPDGSHLLTGSEHGGVRLWDAASGEGTVLRPPRDGDDTTELRVSEVAFAADGETAYAASFDGTITAWDVASGDEVGQVEREGIQWTTLDVDPDDPGQFLAGTGQGGLVAVDLDRDGTELALGEEGDFVVDADISADGRLVAAVDTGTEAEIWDAETGELVLQVPLGAFGRAVAFSPDGGRVVVASAAETAVYDVQQGTKLATYSESAGGMNAATFSPDGLRVLLAGADGVVRVWDPQASIDDVVLELRGHTDEVFDARFDPVGARVVSGSLDGSSRVWSIGHEAEIGIGTYLSDGRLVDGDEVALTASAAPSEVVAWDLDGERVVGRYGPLRSDGLVAADFILDVELSRDRQRVAAAGSGHVDVWEVETGDRVLSTPVDEPPVVARAVALDAEGEEVAVARGDFTLRRHEVGSGEQLGGDVELASFVNDLDYSPDGDLAAVTVDGELFVWGPDGEEGPAFDTPPGSMRAVRFSADGELVATGSSGGLVHLWSARTGELVRTLRVSNQLVNDVAFDPDGERVVAVGNDGAVRVWAVDTGQLLEELPAYGKFPLLGVDVGTDGRSILASGVSIRLLTCDLCVDDDELLDLAEDAVTRSLTAAERETYGLG